MDPKDNPALGARSRIDGILHRRLAATLTLRAADPCADVPDAADGADPCPEDDVLRLRLSVSSETPYLRASWWDEPWIEVLGHKSSEIDLTRLNDGAPILANHDRMTAVGDTPLAGIGAVDSASIEGNRLVADITLSRREALADLRQDIADGLVRNVSIGYLINERVLTKANGEGQPDEYRVTSWTPFEISLVDIPADASVGLGRSQTDPDAAENPAARYRVVDLTPAAGTPLGERSMNQRTTATPADATNTATRAIDTSTGHDPLLVERERAREIRAIGRQFGVAELADTAIDNGTSIEAFVKQMRVAAPQSSALRPAESPEIGLTAREVKSYSFCRALLAAGDPLHAAQLAPFELECARAAQDKRGDSRDKTREAAITIPVDVLNRGISMPGDIAASVARMFIDRANRSSLQSHHMVRDLVVGTPTAGGNLVATELLGSSFIDLLRNALVLDKLGITWLRDLNGNVAIPAATGSATAYWVAESGAPTEAQQTVGQVTLTPKTVGAFTDYSRRLLLQSSLDVEAFVRADLAAIIAQAVQYAAITGAGASNEPTGLLNTSGIGSVALGVNGAVPTYAAMVDLETAVASVNADAGNLAYLTNSKARGKLRKTEEFATTNGRPVWTKGRERGIGSVLDYDAVVSNSVPFNLVKGTSGAVCSAAIFGNWSDLLLGLWGGLDVLLDPYTGSTSGTKRVVALQDLDVAVRRVASFAAIKDMLTT
jgi:HK97 family phage major capsid protein